MTPQESNKPFLLRVAVNREGIGLYDYYCSYPVASGPVDIGCRVVVPYGEKNKLAIAVVIELPAWSDHPDERIKQVSEIVDTSPFFDCQRLEAYKKLGAYYHTQLAQVLFSLTPALLTSIKTTSIEPSSIEPSSLSNSFTESPSYLSEPQSRTLQKLIAALETEKEVLFQGVTGAGKSLLYLAYACLHLKQGKKVLLLEPEIALVESIYSLLRSFDKTLPLERFHSALSPAHRKKCVQAVVADGPLLVIGTRSAIGLPLVDLSAIIIDEEQDSSYKNESGLLYDTRTVARALARAYHIPLILGTATPSIKTLYQAPQKVSLLTRYRNVPDATITLLPIVSKNQQRLDDSIVQEIAVTIKNDQQVLLFINQRGFAPKLSCMACGFAIPCNYCSHTMVVHKSDNKLHCHICGHSKLVPKICDACSSPSLKLVGAGTQRIELQLQEVFGSECVARFDRDTISKKKQLGTLMSTITSGEVKILVGTQLLIKGHNFPMIATCIYLNADQALQSYDYQAHESLAIQLTQLAGRATRYHEGKSASRLLIPTMFPNHPLFTSIMKNGYEAFAQKELQHRIDNTLPPYSSFAIITLIADPKPSLAKTLNQIAFSIRELNTKAISEPIEAPIPIKHGKHHYQILVRPPDKQLLDYWIDSALQILSKQSMPDISYQLDVEPITLD